jgi:hypothetical protein
MSERTVWDDASRDLLRQRLQRKVRGELRLNLRSHEEILDCCREVPIQDEAPEAEWDTLVRFAAAEIDRAADALAAEMAECPAETDCDRLDRVEDALRERGILLWQVSPCCDTCTRSELGMRAGVIDSRYPGFRARARGYAFFIDQHLPGMLAEGRDLSVFLGYGWFRPADREVGPAEYEKNALGIAREICDCLQTEGFEPDWDGDLDRKIGVTIHWQRRERLE